MALFNRCACAVCIGKWLLCKRLWIRILGDQSWNICRALYIQYVYMLKPMHLKCVHLILKGVYKRFFTKTKLNQYQRHSKVVKNCNNSLRNFDISLLHRGALILTWRNRKEGDLRQRQKVQEDQQGGHPAAYESGFLIWQLRHQNRGMFQHLCTLLWHKYR